jgi:hypothetical protein
MGAVDRASLVVDTLDQGVNRHHDEEVRGSGD